MNKIFSICFSLILILISSDFVLSQENLNSREIKNYSLYNTKAEFVYSEIVADSFLILVSVPDDYNISRKSYPVLYVLDGDIAFGMAAGIARYLQIGDKIPELIVVGIGYGVIGKAGAEKRLRDYGPEQDGDAERFLDFINSELIPDINSKYRTEPDDHTISGYSLGGLFALYALFTKPESFSRYIVGSPYLVWDDYSIFRYEESDSEKIGDLDLAIFISVGSEESTEKRYEPIDSLVTNIQKKNHPGLLVETKVFQGSTRLTGPPEVLTHGLISVFSW
jgi:predicted alpha/beta superfamily hydrolase